jgi:hypothetical protein
MNQQDEAALAVWQANRHLSPRERMEILFFDMLLPPPTSEAELDIALRLVSECMA